MLDISQTIFQDFYGLGLLILFRLQNWKRTEINLEKCLVLFRFPEPKNHQAPITRKCDPFCRFRGPYHTPSNVFVHELKKIKWFVWIKFRFARFKVRLDWTMDWNSFRTNFFIAKSESELIRVNLKKVFHLIWRKSTENQSEIFIRNQNLIRTDPSVPIQMNPREVLNPH